MKEPAETYFTLAVLVGRFTYLQTSFTALPSMRVVVLYTATPPC